MKASIIIRDGQEKVVVDGEEYGLGLQFPAAKVQAFPTLATMQPLLSFDEIRNIIESSDFEFGRQYFDDSWLTNQKSYGSCASYAGASAASKARVIGGQDRVDLSGDYLYSLVNGGRDRGSMLDDNMRAIMARGIASAQTVPWGQVFRNRYNTEIADAEAKRFLGHELYAIPDEQSFATALAMRIPVVHAIHVGRRWRQQDGDYLIGDDGPGNHSEHCDDIRYSRTRGQFEFRNGSSHNRPYFWVSWKDHFRTTSRYHQFYAVPSMRQDPQGDNPPSDSPSPAPETRVKLEVTSSPGCIWCTRWDAREKPLVLEAGYELVKANLPGSGVPRFRLTVNNATREKVGYWSFDEILLEAAQLR